MGHGFPVDSGAADGGREGFGVVNAGLPAARHIADFWGIGARTQLFLRNAIAPAAAKL
jgi:hypothetical protein